MNVKIASTVFDIADEEFKDYFSLFVTSEMAEKKIDKINSTDFNEKRLSYFTQITDYLLEHKKTIMVHCSAISVGGRGYAFGAPSGTGKSTHVKLWEKYCPEKVSVINDDKPFFKLEENGFTVYGSPLSGKHNKFSNDFAPLKGFIVIKQSKSNSIVRLEKKEAVKYLLKQFYLANTPMLDDKMLELIKVFVRSVPVYLLECDVSENAYLTCYRFLREEENEN